MVGSCHSSPNSDATFSESSSLTTNQMEPPHHSITSPCFILSITFIKFWNWSHLFSSRVLFLFFFFVSLHLSQNINSIRTGTKRIGSFPLLEESPGLVPHFQFPSFSMCRSICPLSKWTLAPPCDLFWPVKCEARYSSLPGGRFMNYLPCKDEVVVEAYVMMVPPSAWAPGWQQWTEPPSGPHWTSNVNKK